MRPSRAAALTGAYAQGDEATTGSRTWHLQSILERTSRADLSHDPSAAAGTAVCINAMGRAGQDCWHADDWEGNGRFGTTTIVAFLWGEGGCVLCERKYVLRSQLEYVAWSC